VAPRRLALELLARIEDDGAWANLVVPRALDRCDLGDADRRLVTELTYGTVRQRRRLDAIIDPFLDRRPAEVAVRALRLGVYQLEVGFPDHAALNTTVGAVPKRWRAWSTPCCATWCAPARPGAAWARSCPIRTGRRTTETDLGAMWPRRPWRR
jgi:hypothetical protein